MLNLQPTFVQSRRILLSVSLVSLLGIISFSLFSLSPTAWSQVSDFFPWARPGTVSPLDASPAENPIPELPKHRNIQGGLLAVTIGGRHPLHDLMVDAEAKWNDMLERLVYYLDQQGGSFQKYNGI